MPLAIVMAGTYDSRNIPRGNRKLKTYLYKGSSKISNTEIITDGALYSYSFLHHISFQEVVDFLKEDQVSFKSWCDDFGDLYTFLHFYAYDGEISLLGF